MNTSMTEWFAIASVALIFLLSLAAFLRSGAVQRHADGSMAHKGNGFNMREVCSRPLDFFRGPWE